MKIRGLILVLAASGMAVPAGAKNKKETPVPQLFCQAQYVYVQTYEGDPLNMDVTPEDRAAAYQLTQQLQAWKRYVLVNERHQADLVFVVRTGRAITAQSGDWRGGPAGPDQNPAGMGRNPGGMQPGPGGPGTGPGMSPGPQGVGTPTSASGSGPGGAGAAVGPVNDLLAIYQRPADVQTQQPLWQRSRHEGLAAPNLPLFQQVKSAVDAACQNQPPMAKAPPAQ